MAISNENVVNTASKYTIKSTGIGGETDQQMIDSNLLIGFTNESTVSLIECYYLIENVGSTAGKLTIEVDTPALVGGTGYTKLTMTGKGKYGLRPSQLRFGEDKQFKLTTDSNVRSYLLVTEFRRN